MYWYALANDVNLLHSKTTLIRQLERLRSLNDKDPLRDATKIKEDHYMRCMWKLIRVY